MMKVVASVGKGMTIIAKSYTARVIAVASSVGNVTISIAVRSVYNAPRVPHRRR